MARHAPGIGKQAALISGKAGTGGSVREAPAASRFVGRGALDAGAHLPVSFLSAEAAQVLTGAGAECTPSGLLTTIFLSLLGVLVPEGAAWVRGFLRMRQEETCTWGSPGGDAFAALLHLGRVWQSLAPTH